MIGVPPLPFPWNCPPPPSVFLFPVCIARQHPLAWAGVGGSKSHGSTETLVLYTVHNTQFTTEAMKYNVPLPSHRSSADPYGEINDIQRKPREIYQSGKKSAKVYHSLYSSTEQLQVAL
jgi:hypothetical protein